jgi:mono/diheme cytochrome c family protein
MSKATENKPAHASDGKVEMPAPTAWPVMLAAGITLAMLGVATSPVFSIAGGVLFFVAIIGWISQLLPGRGHEFEELATASKRPKAIAARPGTVEQLKPGVVGYRFQLPEKVHPVSAGFKGGIWGGIVMTVPALAWGLFSGNGIWFPVNLLAGMVLPGLDVGSQEEVREHLQSFLLGPFIIAIVIHITMSIGLGLIYGVILPTLPPVPGGPLVLGGIVLPALWTAASHSLMGLVNPLLHIYVDWPSFVASQFVYGIVASIIIMRSEKIPIAPRGPGGDEGEPSPPSGWLGCIAFFLLALSGCSDNLPGKPKLDNEYRRPETITNFVELYKINCAGCHGADGTLGPGPPLNDPLFLALVSKEELETVIAHGGKGTLMPAWSQPSGGSLTAEQIASLVEGIKGREWGGEASKVTKTIPSDAPPLLPKSDANGNAERGEKIFAVACATCHGEKGEGIKNSAGAINNPAMLSLMSNMLLRRIIITGRTDLKMPGFADSDGRGSDFKPLTAEDVDDLVALLSSWRESSPKK